MQQTSDLQSVLIQSLPPGEYRKPLVNLMLLRFQAKIDPQQRIDVGIPVYNRYFSEEEITGLIKFQDTPTAQKLAAVQPQMVQEAIDEGVKLGPRLYLVCTQELLSEHPELAGAFGMRKEDLPPKSSVPSLTVSWQTEIDAAKQAAIRRLLALTVDKDSWTAMLQVVHKQLQPFIAASLPAGEDHDKAVALLYAKVESKVNLDLVSDFSVPFYARHFSTEDLDFLIKFYETPLARKAVSTAPAVLKDAVEAFTHVTQKLMVDSLQEVLVEHRDLADAYQAALRAHPEN